MQRKLRRIWTSLALALVLSFTLSLSAQTFRGGINGTVTDSTGAAISGAKVVATETATGVTHDSVSSSSGEFLFNDLPLGDYSVSVMAPGFSNIKVDKLPVSAGVIYTLPVKMPVSSSTETVEVDAAGISLDTTTVTQTTVLDAKTVADIPLNGRDFTQLIALTPGFGGYSADGTGSLNGTRANQLNWQIDGVDNNDLWHNIPAVNQGGVSGIAGIILPIDAVDQFSAQTQAGPEGGRNPGGTINLTLRTGGNQIHGTAYYFNRNELFGAKSPLVDTKGKVRNYNTGFSVGGPFIKDKLFGFLTFEHQRFVIGESGSATEPSDAYVADATAQLAARGLAVNPVMLNVLHSVYPTVIRGLPETVDNYHSSDPEFGYSWNGLAKVDYHLSEKDNISAHWFVGQGNQVAPVGSQLLAYYEVAPIHVQNIALLENHVFSNSISNQILIGVNYFNQVFNDNLTNQDVQSQGFITGASFPNAPHIIIGSSSGSHFDLVGETPPEGRNDITGHLTDQLSWVKGKHQMRFGGEFRQAQLDEFYHRKSTGSFTFDGSQGGGAGYIGSLEDFLVGKTAGASITIGDPERQVFVNTWFLNAGDSWQITHNLNINYGIRYDYEGPLHNQYQNMSVFRPELTASNGLAFQGNQIASLYPQYYKNISPRVGISYSPDSKTVFRAGFGFYADTPNLNPFLDNRPGNAAPNGVEGNPGGGSPVYNISPQGGANVTIVQGQAIFPSTVNYPCAATSPCGVFSVAPNFRPSYDENFNLNLEHTFNDRMIVQIGYVGSSARHLLSLLDINQAQPGVYTNTTDLFGNVIVSADLKRQQTRPYFSQYPQYNNINQISPIGTSNYNSLQAQARINNWHHVTMQAVYTWSHNLDEVSQFRGALPQSSTNFKGDYSNSDYDTRNNFTTYASYEVPGSQHLKRLTNGWQVNGLLNFHGGQPFTIFASGDISGVNEGLDRAVQIAPARTGYQGQHPNANWIDLTAFADPTPGTFGTTRRNQYFGPGFSDVDFSVFKNTKIGERVTVQFRAEMFNLFNRANYSPPNDNSISVGGSSALNDTIGSYNGAPGIGSGEAFNTQFGGKIIF